MSEDIYSQRRHSFKAQFSLENYGNIHCTLKYKYNDTIYSQIIYIFYFRHVYWLNLHPDYLFLMYFVRCQMTVTVTLLLVYGPKVCIPNISNLSYESTVKTV